MRNKKDVIIRVGWHVVFLLILHVLQTTVFSRLLLFGVRPVIMPLAVAGIALFQGSVRGGLFGLAAGVLCDLGYNETIVLFTLLLTATGLAVGALSERVLTRGFPSYFLCAPTALLLTAFFQMFSFLVFERIPFLLLGRIALYQTLYSLLFVLPIYFPARRISRRIRPM